MDPLLKLFLVVACSRYMIHTTRAVNVLQYAKLAGIYGQQQLQLDKQHNHIYHQNGNDNTDINHYYNQLALFGTPSPVSRQRDRCAYFRLKMTLRFTEISRKPFSYLFKTPYFHHVWEQLIQSMCPPPPVPTCHPRSRYSNIDGTCNNILHPMWGSANIAQVRFLKPAYDNGIDSPRTKSVKGGYLRSTRVISNAVFKPAKSTVLDPTVSVMHMSFGQFLDHDLIFTPKETGEGNVPIKCCKTDQLIKNRDECFPIIVPSNDNAIKEKCMNFVRSSAATPIGESYGKLEGEREQENEITSYIDASNVYGSDKKKMDQLRSFTYGMLKTDKYHRLPAGNGTCMKVVKEDICQDAGDKRVNVVPNLGSIHWLWLQQHNRIAYFLHKYNRHWDDETVFQETRKIIIAMMQHIVYKEYLPLVIGEAMMQHFNLKVPTRGYRYNSNIDAGTSNVFGAAAFRFGHSQITNKQITTPIEQTFHKAHMVLANNGRGYQDVIRWLNTDRAAKSDVQFEAGVRDKLFKTPDGSLDLAAVNTQRGRDHGLPGYNAWRVWAGLPKATDFHCRKGGLTRMSTRNVLNLKKVYSHVDDIDLFPGAMSETPLSGGLVGPTFATILGKQFFNYKFGDRFWYENNVGRYNGFTSRQLAEIRKITYAKVICDNVNVNKMQRNAFNVVHSTRNPLVDCSKIPGINLNLWKDPFEGFYRDPCSMYYLAENSINNNISVYQ